MSLSIPSVRAVFDPVLSAYRKVEHSIRHACGGKVGHVGGNTSGRPLLQRFLDCVRSWRPENRKRSPVPGRPASEAQKGRLPVREDSGRVPLIHFPVTSPFPHEVDEKRSSIQADFTEASSIASAEKAVSTEDILNDLHGQVKDLAASTAQEVLAPLSSRKTPITNGRFALPALVTSMRNGHRSPGVVKPSELKDIERAVQKAFLYKLDGLLARTSVRMKENGHDARLLLTERTKLRQRAGEIARQGCVEAGWSTETGIEWTGDGPLLLKSGMSLKGLKHVGNPYAEGGCAAIMKFEVDDGREMIGKISKGDVYVNDKLIGDLASELSVYKQIYDTVGPHKSLVNVYGITEYEAKFNTEDGVGSAKTSVLLMDAVPGGRTAREVFTDLRKCLDAGRISMEEYASATSYIERSILDVALHLKKAGIVHADIKPDNVLVNERSGEVVVIDLGLSVKTGDELLSVSLKYAPRDARPGETQVDERHDVFSAAATLLAGVENYWNYPELENSLIAPLPNDGLKFNPKPHRNTDGKITRQFGVAAVQTDYTRFLKKAMAPTEKRATLEKAKAMYLMTDTHDTPIRSPRDRKENGIAPELQARRTGDTAARNVLRKTIRIAKEEQSKSREEQWKVRSDSTNLLANSDAQGESKKLYIDLATSPDLKKYAQLYRRSEHDPELRIALDKNFAKRPDGAEINVRHQRIVDHMATSAANLATKAWWAEDLSTLLESVENEPVGSGVTGDGRRNENNSRQAELAGIAWDNANAVLEQMKHRGLDVHELSHYAEVAGDFLRDAMTLKDVRDGTLDEGHASNLDRVRRNVQLTRQVTELIKTRELREPSDTPPTGKTRQVLAQFGQTESPAKRRLGGDGMEPARWVKTETGWKRVPGSGKPPQTSMS